MSRSPYLSAAPSVSVIMLKVALALIPGIIAYVYVYGPAILVTILLATITALGSEALMLKLRNRPIKPFLMDGSALVTGWLLALAIPPLAPWWLIVVGVSFSIVIAKQLYGGLGYNPFNPAMVGYAVLLISFPLLMSGWAAPLALIKTQLSFAEQLNYMFAGHLPMGVAIDALTSATPLDYLKTQLTLNHTAQDVMNAPIFGAIGGKGNEFVTFAYLLGGIYLLQQKIISWHLPVAFLAAITLVSGAFYLADANHYVNPLFHLFSGATMFAAFFIITDPVSGPTTPNGKLFFAAGVGVLTYLIRVLGGYPEGVAFAVIIFNICVPLIDTYTQPRVFGHAK